MTSINSVQNQQVTYLTGINSAGIIADQSFWTWNSDTPASYGPGNYVSKWGSSTAGSVGLIGYAFDPVSNWTATEKAAFVSSMDLWSAVANVTFTELPDDIARFTITRNADGKAAGGVDFYMPSTIGSSRIGTTVSASISIDASAEAFGPLGTAFRDTSNYSWMTMLHEIGHVLGLGHGGPYDEGLVDQNTYTAYDSRAWTIMSYNDEGTTGDGQRYAWGRTVESGGSYANVPTTWMPLDIVAIQRLYGVAINTPLSGGQTFGFHSNIQGDIAKYFDFNLNSRPIVTLWSKGDGNILDLSGFTQGSNVNLADGSFSSVAGLTNNIAIAYGTHINTAIGGPGADTIVANANSDVVMGGTGADSITGGSGNDHLYGAGPIAMAGDGADTIFGGDGSDYIQGNAGNDLLDGGAGSDRIQGGQGDDVISGGAGNDSVNGNLGNDRIDGGDGNDSLRGGQGADSIDGGAGNDILLGDLGADTLTGGAGLDVLTGGGDSDLFVFGSGDAVFATSGALAWMTDMITDFTDGVDHIRMTTGVPSAVLHGAAFASLAEAATNARQLLDAQAGVTDVAVLKVGNDSYLFYDSGPSSPLEAVKLQGFADPALITSADFA